MVGTPVSSRYSYTEMLRMNQRRRVPRAQYQKEATLKRMTQPEDLWANHMGVNCGPIPSGAAMEKVHSLGLEWVTFSPEFGWYKDTGKAIEEFRRIQQAGLNAHLVLQVASHNYDNTIINPALLLNYLWAFCDAGVNAVSLLNEPNNKNFWQNLDSSFQGVAYICGYLVREIRMRFPDLPIYAPGWSPAGGDYSPKNAMEKFCLRLQEQHVPPSLFTGPSMHPYTYNGVGFGLPAHPEWNPHYQTPDVWRIAKNRGMPGPLSLSEFGVPSQGMSDDGFKIAYSEEHQAQVIEDQLTDFLEWREGGIPIDFMCISTAIDGDASTRPIEDSMGLFRKDGSEKPAADVVRKFAQKEWDLAYSA